jgi:hypothetical protein
MTEATAALIGALIGAMGGVAGGFFGAIASLRASQTAARAPIAPTLHRLAVLLIKLRVTKGTPEYDEIRRDFESQWSELAIQQRILCPSKRIEGLLALVWATTRDTSSKPDDLLTLAGQSLDKITRMVGAHSQHLFRWKAHRTEKEIICDWLASLESKILSSAARAELDKLVRS